MRGAPVAVAPDPFLMLPMPNTTHDAVAELERRLALFGDDARRALLRQGLRGIEKESLRVGRTGQLALTPHPFALGSALTHPQLTTDYSEALLEIITPAQTDAALTLASLDTLHRHVYAKLDGEILWNESMPGTLPPDDEIPIAEYGSSNIGRLKHVYRQGLALRYGRAMQCIAGIHYNYSLSEDVWRVLREAEGVCDEAAVADQSRRYLALIRNFRRYSWLLMLLFGASPAVGANFLSHKPHRLERLDADTLYLPYATSLRMSDLGYQNNPAQSGMSPSYDTLAGYLQGLAQAVSQPHPAYEKIGTHRDGAWVQINTHVLQIENEFYSTIRPKRVVRSGERPIHALAERGVQYVEVRCLDIDPFEPIGLNLSSARFIDAFLLFCALQSSPSLPPAALDEANANFALVVSDGRRPGLMLRRDGEPIALEAWAAQLFDQIETVARVLDAAQPTPAAASPNPIGTDGASGDAAADTHLAALTMQRAKLADLSLTPSARVLRTMREEGLSFEQFALKLSLQHADSFKARPLDAAQHAVFEQLAQASHAEQAKLEREDSQDFDAFVQAYQQLDLPAPFDKLVLGAGSVD
jgi:glutamate--cysteine ligase